MNNKNLTRAGMATTFITKYINIANRMITGSSPSDTDSRRQKNKAKKKFEKKGRQNESENMKKNQIIWVSSEQAHFFYDKSIVTVDT